MNEPKDRISITIDPQVLARIDEVCERSGEARSAMIERVMSYALEDLDEELKRLESPVIQAVTRALVASPELFAALSRITEGKVSREEAELNRKRLQRNLSWARERKKRKRVEENGNQG